MHAYRRYVQEEMDRRGWKQADLARASGLSTAVISRMLVDDRDAIRRPPSTDTVAGLARAFRVADQIVWLRVAQAMGLPVGDAVTVADAALLSDDALLDELRERLRRAGGTGQGATIHPLPTRSGPDLELADAAYAPDEPTAAELRERAEAAAEAAEAAEQRRLQDEADDGGA